MHPATNGTLMDVLRGGAGLPRGVLSGVRGVPIDHRVHQLCLRADKGDAADLVLAAEFLNLLWNSASSPSITDLGIVLGEIENVIVVASEEAYIPLKPGCLGG